MSTDALQKHLANHACMPFPAGPVIPREATLPVPGWPADAKAAQRFRTAVALIEAEHAFTHSRGKDKHNRDKTTSPMTEMMALAFGEWHSRHPDTPVAGIEDTLLQALATLGSARRGGGVADFLGRFRERRAKHRRAKHNNPATPDPVLAFAAPAYCCACHAAEPNADDPPAPRHSAYVSQVLAMPKGSWLLLGLFFLTQFHGHLAWKRIGAAYHDNTAQVYERVLLHLRHLARRQGRWSECAAGLLEGLPELEPYLARGGQGARLPPGAPACFSPALLQPRQASLQEVQALLAQHGDLASLAADADALARELAACLTDLHMALALELNLQHAKYFINQYERVGRALREAAKEARAGKAPGLPEAPNHLKDRVIPAVVRLLQYWNWVDARKLLVASTNLLPPAQPQEPPAQQAYAAPARHKEAP